MDKKQLETSDTKNELKWCESKQTEENPEQSLAGGGLMLMTYTFLELKRMNDNMEIYLYTCKQMAVGKKKMLIAYDTQDNRSCEG